VSILLSTSQIAAMRATLERSLPGTAVITSRAWQSDGGGGGTAGYAPSGTAACRVSPAGQQPIETEIAAQVAGRALYMVTLPANTVITSDNRIEADGREFEVIKPLSRDWEISLRVICVEIS
jgi:hypothetical protein